MSMTEPEVIEKLQKLLRLAESANEHESALALERAQELAIRHRIELASVQAWGDERAEADPIGRLGRTHHKRSMAHRYVGWIVRGHFNVDLIYSGKTVYFIGSKSDIDFAKYVWDFLELEFRRLFNAYCVENRRPTGDRRARSSYYYGLYAGLSKKLESAKRQATADALASVAHNTGQTNENVAGAYALAIRKNELAVKAAVKQFFPHIRTTKTRISVGNFGAMGAGERDGARINLSRPLNGGNGQAARLR
jgi:hypothetical protein